MRISLTFPQISALCSSVCVPHRNNRAARDSPQEVWEATHLGTYAQLREEGFFLFPYSEADKYVVFSCLFLRHLKGEGIKQEEILEDKYKVALHTRSVYFLLHISIFHLLHPHKQKSRKQLTQLGRCSLGERTRGFGEGRADEERKHFLSWDCCEVFQLPACDAQGRREKLGSFSQENSIGKESDRHGTLISHFYQHGAGLLRVVSKE